MGLSLPFALPHARNDARGVDKLMENIMKSVIKGVTKKEPLKKFKSLNIGLFTLTLLATGQNALAGAEDDPLLTMVKIDQLEKRNGDEDPLVFEGQAWIGYDLEKIWLKAEGERVEGKNESMELQLLYSKAISPFWDIQFGARRDFKPEPERNWGVIGFQGVAPYYAEIDTVLFIGESGRTSLRFEAEYELMLTQRLVLIPEVELNFFGKIDEETDTGSGLSSSEMGLRLAYEIRREFSPYIGVSWENKYGATADFAKAEGELTNDTQFVIGVSGWF
jgi:copper resistance protein B